MTYQRIINSISRTKSNVRKDSQTHLILFAISIALCVACVWYCISHYGTAAETPGFVGSIITAFFGIIPVTLILFDKKRLRNLDSYEDDVNDCTPNDSKPCEDYYEVVYTNVCAEKRLIK